MLFLDFYNSPVWLNLGVFLLVAIVIWIAGTRLTVYADVIAERTGLGRAFIGLVLLASATSLPELGRTVSAASIGDAPLVINSLLGGILLQSAVLAIADVAVGAGALTFVSPRPVLVLEGAFLMILIALVLVGIAAGTFLSLFGIGFWSVLLLVAYLLTLYLLWQYEGSERWRPVDMPELPPAMAKQMVSSHLNAWSVKRVILHFAFGAMVVLVCGVILSPVGEALARQTGLGGGFIGATLLAVATSLPELSTTVAAARLGAYSLAISNIFGSNMLLVALIFVADVFYRPGPVLADLDRSAVFAAAMGICVTGIYLAGLIERHNRTILRMGFDSVAVLVLYLGSTVMLYILR